jgi:hypothetical protein
MLHVSRDVVGAPATHDARKEGRSGYGLFGMLRLFGNLIINNSSLLLRWVGQLGIFFALASFASISSVAVESGATIVIATIATPVRTAMPQPDLSPIPVNSASLSDCGPLASAFAAD